MSAVEQFIAARANENSGGGAAVQLPVATPAMLISMLIVLDWFVFSKFKPGTN